MLCGPSTHLLWQSSSDLGEVHGSHTLGKMVQCMVSFVCWSLSCSAEEKALWRRYCAPELKMLAADSGIAATRSSQKRAIQIFQGSAVARKVSGLNSDCGVCMTRSRHRSQLKLPGRSGPPLPIRRSGRQPPKTSTDTPTGPNVRARHGLK